MKNAELKTLDYFLSIPVHDLGYLIQVSNAPVTLGQNWTLKWSLHLIWNSLGLKCRVEDLYLPPKYFCPYFGIFGSIIPQNAWMPQKWQDSWFERDQFGCTIWIQRFLFIRAHDLGALNHFPYPQGGMTSYWNDLRATAVMAIPNCKYRNVNFSLCFH